MKNEYTILADTILSDTSASFALKKVVKEWDSRDPLDALNDAEALSALFEVKFNQIARTPKKMKASLTKEEADFLWRLLLQERTKLFDLYGNNSLTDSLLDLLYKFIFPESEK